jgi:hypothetical protein
MRHWATRKKCKFVYLNIIINYKLDNNLLTVEPRAVDPHCFEFRVSDPDPYPDPDPHGSALI